MALQRTILIILKGYPRLSETFIAQEIRALEFNGLSTRPDVVVFLDGLNDLTNGANWCSGGCASSKNIVSISSTVSAE